MIEGSRCPADKYETFLLKTHLDDPQKSLEKSPKAFEIAFTTCGTQNPNFLGIPMSNKFLVCFKASPGTVCVDLGVQKTMVLHVFEPVLNEVQEQYLWIEGSRKQ